MSLLQDVLRTQTLDSLDKTLAAVPSSQQIETDSDDELVNVVSIPGTPARSRPASRPASRAASPSRGAKKTLRGTALLSSHPSTDPLKAFPTEISQRIFGHFSISELAKCARVSRKWSRSQTINYVWFQNYRKEHFHDDHLPPGKWSKRESKQNWRITYLNVIAARERESLSYSRPQSRASGTGSGYQTPQELREEKWKSEAEGQIKPSKVEMRELYKELGGRKVRGKGKISTGGTRDKGGWGEDAGGTEDY
ncbi:hypothetical protein PHLCEN_2v5656 [Hermanssonia centrifuga]|uniref:F-box domain-containing protein n=1 Tax=Hermanssonia centrifuga TaxID=98765 RepID=A0A2R6P1Q8_9APHY|nr:hypothetical protein PHLCEN_2v5656 [Hermanssonia centrifuga]